ncbi:MAG: GAF domain-containing protein [Bryobacteraceae bacterium]
MEKVSPTHDGESRLANLIEDQRAAALDQVEAAWQLYISRIEEVLATGWREHLAAALNGRFSEIAVTLEEAFAEQLARRTEQMRASLRAQLADSLNQALRRFRAAESEREVLELTIELAGLFCARAALAIIPDSGRACFTAWRDFLGDFSGRTPVAEIALDSAPALQSAVQSRETVVAERTSSELSDSVAAFFEGVDAEKVILVPVVDRDRTLALLCCAQRGPQLNLAGLELIAMLAGLALESKTARRPQPWVAISGAAVPGPEWPGLSRSDAEFHASARRFARVQVAEMRLFKSQAVREGRQRQDLYAALRPEIDAAREAFRNSYLNACPTMVDYLHLELVRTLANDDASLLGAEYPGPLV